MIDPRSRSLEWIRQAKDRIPGVNDTPLIEKAIRALSLLESLVRSGCPFIFKGGTALMLHLNTSRRLSIDVDIVCPTGTDIKEYLGKYAEEYGFTGAEEIERFSRTGVPKSHAEYHYAVSYPSGHPTDKILLDVLYEDIHYNQVVDLPIASPLLIQNGAPVTVPCPSLADMLGDKLTAFAPHTTGIPFFKHGDPFFMEIMKQLYDVSSILDRIDDLSTVRKTYSEIVPIELGYRKLDHLTESDVLEDTLRCAMNICLRGGIDRTEYGYYADGARRVNFFIIPESYNVDVAIRDAAKVAYLVRLLQTGNNEVKHYSPDMDGELASTLIEDQSLNKLNRIKKISLEAFFYCLQLELLHFTEADGR
ncbi:MAG: nucleotidyl transferase AbiEii/AbiGii toxin family protein [Paludibacteraceae bacterium]|nr:nucleotidyl transferase AbiEii/AbiGii toxin family protein [Paludibacteraceae bacterium]